MAVLEHRGSHRDRLADHGLGGVPGRRGPGPDVLDHEASRHTPTLPAAVRPRADAPTGQPDRHRSRHRAPSRSFCSDEGLRSFTVRARLPEALAPCRSWRSTCAGRGTTGPGISSAGSIPQIWELTFHDPVRLLSLVGRQRLDQLAADPAFMGFLGEMHDDLRRYLEAPRWFQNRAAQPAARRRLLLPRVRHRRGPAPVLGRPRACSPATT